MSISRLLRWCAVVAAVSSFVVATGAAAASAAPAAATSGRLGFSPTVITFDVRAGQTSVAQPVSVINGTAAPAHIAGLVSSDPRFHLGAGCGVQAIPAGGRCTTTLTYVDDGATTTASATLSGAGALTLAATASVERPLSAVPDVLFPSTFVGDVAPGSRTIVVRNQGAGPLTLAGSVDAPTTALAFDFGKCLGRTLAAGATCPVSVRFKPSAGLADSAAVTLTTADGTWSVVVRASGVSRPRLTTAEGQLQWNDVQVGTTTRRLLHVRNAAPGAVTVTGVTAPRGVTVASDACSGVTLRGAATCAVAVDYTAPLPPSAGAAVRVDSSAGPLDVPLVVGSRRPFLVTPTGLAFGAQVVGGSSAPQDVVVTNETAVSQRVSATIGVVPGFAVATNGCTGAVLAPGADCRIGVVFSPTSPNPYSGYYRPVHVSGLVAGQVSLAGYGVAAPPASFLRLTPSSLDFGDVDLADPPVAQTLTVTNQGTSAVTLTGSLRRPAGFQIVDPCTGTRLAAGASCTLTVRARPTVAGASTYLQAVLTWNGVAFYVPLAVHADTELAMGGDTQLGPVDLGGTASGTLQFTDVGSEPVTLQGAPPLVVPGGSDPVGIAANGCDGVTLQPGDSCPVTVSVTPTTTASSEIVVGGAWSGQQVPGAVAVQVQRWFTVDATQIDVGTAADTDPPSATVTVTNVGTVARAFPRCDVQIASFAVTGCGGADLAPGATRTLTVRIVPDNPPTTQGQLALFDSDTGSSATVALRGATLFALAVPTTHLQLGPQAVGSAAPSQDLWVFNGSRADATVLANVYPDRTVAVTNGCQNVVLHPGGGCAVTLTFTPSSGQKFTDQLDVFLGNPGIRAERIVTLARWGY